MHYFCPISEIMHILHYLFILTMKISDNNKEPSTIHAAISCSIIFKELKQDWVYLSLFKVDLYILNRFVIRGSKLPVPPFCTWIPKRSRTKPSSVNFCIIVHSEEIKDCSTSVLLNKDPEFPSVTNQRSECLLNLWVYLPPPRRKFRA